MVLGLGWNSEEMTQTALIPQTLSPQQTAVIDWAVGGSGSSFVEAVAGAGKTTGCLIPLLRVIDGSVAFCAFNKKIVVEIQDKVDRLIAASLLPADLKQRLRIGTFHSFGLNAWKRTYKNCKVDVKAKTQRSKAWLEAKKVPAGLHDFVLSLVSLAKQRAIGVFGAIDDRGLWWDIVDHFDLAYEADVEDEAQLEAGVTAAIALLRAHIKIAPELIDFDDMIYMPAQSGMKLWENDWALVDEAQDTNPARRALVRKMLKAGGRSCWVGDRHQAIYGFSGADSDAVDQIIKEFRCDQLPLTITYRCPKSVVKEARGVVSHIQAAETAPEGTVTRIDIKDVDVKSLTASDAILCRNTKPLVEMAYRLIRQGIACHVEGRAIGDGLVKLATKWKVKSIDALRDRLDTYKTRETQKLIAKGRETQAEALADRVDTLFVLAEGCKTVDDLATKIGRMFVDSADEVRPTLTLSTVHKAKGREWGKVLVIGYDTLMPSPFARQAWQQVQESNLRYVAYTRAQSHLILVHLPVQSKEQNQ
jgi:superfamily I DNA/RNA helicase